MQRKFRLAEQPAVPGGYANGRYMALESLHASVSGSVAERQRTGKEPGVALWVRLVPGLALLDAALFAVLQARIGAAGPVLWTVGPLLIQLIATGLLIAALVWSVRKRTVWNRTGAAACLCLAAIAGSVPFVYWTYPSSHDDTPSPIGFRLPLEGPVTVAWGGRTRSANYHATMPDQRWAYDLLITKDGQSFRGDGAELADYYCYDRPVLAPAAGLVREAVDREPDMPIGRSTQLTRVFGNHVVIEVAPRQFLVIAHMRRGSLRVARGDEVRAGQEIGRVGNSGHSTEPHVHVHLQDRNASLFAEGIPLYFAGYRRAGQVVARGMPEGGVEDGWFRGEVIEQLP